MTYKHLVGRVLLGCLFGAVSVSVFAQMKSGSVTKNVSVSGTVELGSGWTMQEAAVVPGAQLAGGQVSLPEFKSEGWYAATVPVRC